MKSPLASGAVFFVCCCCLHPAHAQVYAPATEYHDPVQRVFVVEAARVLAWWTERGATNLTEVTYDVTIAEAVVLLGGRESDAFTQLLIAYLEKDQAKALDNLNLLNTQHVRNEQIVLAFALYKKLHSHDDYKDIDLKPPGAMSIRQAVLQKLKAEGRLNK